jgi:ubiquitin-protein ligase
MSGLATTLARILGLSRPSLGHTEVARERAGTRVADRDGPFVLDSRTSASGFAAASSAAPRPTPAAPAAVNATETPGIGARPAPGASASISGNRRLAETLRSIHETPQVNLWCEVALRDENLRAWQVWFYFTEGPLAEALWGQEVPACEVAIDFPADYPRAAPRVRVVRPRLTDLDSGRTGIYGGALCLQLLHDWDPRTSEDALLMHLHCILSSARVVSPEAYTEQDAVEGERYIHRVHPWGRRAAPQRPS